MEKQTSYYNSVHTAGLIAAFIAEFDIKDNVVDSSLLFTAIERRSVLLVSFLLGRGANPNQTMHPLAQSPLHLACQTSGIPVEILSLLLENGASAAAITDTGKTPLHLACVTKDNAAAVLCLLQYGADPNAKDFQANTPLHCASGSGSIQSVMGLLSLGSVLDPMGSEGTPLHVAIATKHVSVAAYLLQMGANGNIKTPTGETALHLACTDASLEAVELLVSFGVFLNEVNAVGNTPLHNALISDHDSDDVVHFLLDQDSIIHSLRTHGYFGGTPLHFVSSGDRFDIAIKMVNRGASKYALDAFHNTPIDNAEKKCRRLTKEELDEGQGEMDFVLKWCC